MLGDENNTPAGEKFLYLDSKLAQLTLKSINMRALSIHTLMTIGLHEIKSGSSETTINCLFEYSKDWSLEEPFIDWIEEHTPYKYSRKKKCMMRNDKKTWNIDSAFLNPLFASKELLHKKLEELPDGNKEYSGFFDLDSLFDSIIKELDSCQRLIEKRKNYHRKKGFLQTDSQLREFSSGLNKPRNIKKNKKKKKPKSHYLSDGGNDLVTESNENKEEDKVLDATQCSIKKYLSQNPLPDKVGPLGLPQSKYRHGTYGIGSMEYDAWSRWRKN